MEQNMVESKAISDITPDQIQKKVVLRATVARVWRALTRLEEFGTWFGANLTGEMLPGSTIRGPITHPGFTHFTMEMVVERVEPERVFAFRWHPYSVEPGVDYSGEPTTLVPCEPSSVPEGTSLTVTESGFSHIPAGRRPLAFRMNDKGWGMQIENIARHLAAAGE